MKNIVAVSIYAEDTNVTVWSDYIRWAVRELNIVIEMLEPWLSKWRIRIHINECSTTLFSKECNHFHYDPSTRKIFQSLYTTSYRLEKIVTTLNKSSHININPAVTIYKSLTHAALA